MKWLNWFKTNINLVSFFSGVVFIAIGKTEIGHILIGGPSL